MARFKPRERRDFRRLTCARRSHRVRLLNVIPSIAQYARKKAPDQRCGDERDHHPQEKGAQPVVNRVHNRPPARSRCAVRI